MPELPEIALFKKYLDSTALHQKISRVDFPGSGVLQNSPKEMQKALVGNSLEQSRRLGKYLMVGLKSGDCLVFHFGMTGGLEYYKNQEAPKYSKMVICFDNGYELAYTNRRKLGKIYLAEDCEQFQEDHSLGEDALELSEKEFLNLLEDKKGSIKGVLMDQKTLSGIGNVYSDEMLYQSGIHPKTKTDKLSETQRKTLFRNMISVLETAIDKEGERSEFPSDFLSRHRKKGEPCPKCSGKIEKISVSGRSTYFCPSCQKEDS